MPFRAKRPIMFALVGDSGAGKSTLARGCVDILGGDRVTSICLDDYHALDRAARTAAGVTALHPDGNHLGLMGQHARLLRHGETIFKPVYDHSDGTFGAPEFVRPGSVVLINGLHGLYTPELRALWDVSVYLDPDPELRVAWKIKRDTAKRGYNEAQVRKELEARRHDSETYIAPQRERADIVITFRAPEHYARTKDDSRLDVRIRIAHPIPLPDIEDLFGGETARYLRMERGAGGADIVEIDGGLDDPSTQLIEDRMWKHMPAAKHLRSTRLGAFQDISGERRSNPLAVTQLIITYYLVKASALAEKQEKLAAAATAAHTTTAHTG
jgi:phosphoribulokinase